ncbi:MAG: ribonuclease J [Chloroflexota bacterium]
MPDTLKLIPLGGLGEVGKNMTLLQYGDDAIMVDCGLMFPTSDMLGVDIVIPDITYLLDNLGLLKAILITHGHEDHIGAIPYVLRQMSAPIYATRLTCGFIENKLKQARGVKPRDINLNIIADGDTIEIGPFTIEPFFVSHSIPDAVGMAIHTPLGLVIHTGEFKFDDNPASGLVIDRDRLRSFGDQGTLLLMSDSTNAEKLGSTPSEQTIADSIDQIFDEASGRVIVATFASNIYRVQMIGEIAMAHNRKLALVGRSMIDNCRIAQELGYLNLPDDMIMPIERISQLPDHEITIVCTGTQGERNSALVRMANREHHQVELVEDDTVIISATTIPGNEEPVNRNLDNLYRLQAKVYYQSLRPVHVSGHASQEGQKEMISLTRPKYFAPIQGEYRMQVLHGELAEALGMDPENIIITDNGQVTEFTEEGLFVGDPVPAGEVFVDGGSVGDIGNVVLRDRASLANAGFLTCSVALDEQTGDLIDGPNIVSRGFIYVRENEALLDEAADVVVEALEKINGSHTQIEETRNTINDALSQFLYRRTYRRPMVFSVILQV